MIDPNTFVATRAGDGVFLVAFFTEDFILHPTFFGFVDNLRVAS
jgi:hypothetical protein